MNNIGGYFELEIKKRKKYFHSNSIKLNLARNALLYLLEANDYKKIFIPFFTCDAVLEPIKACKIDFERYYVNSSLEPIFEFSKLSSSDVFIYNNYFGLKDEYILGILPKLSNIIVDNSQAFYSKSYEFFDSFYSPRKFFGVSDGAYLYSKILLNKELENDHSYSRMSHLLMRSDNKIEDGYIDFIQIEKSLSALPLRKMSKLTETILSSIDYEFSKKRRIQNFNELHKQIGKLNKFKFSISKTSVPYSYPFLSNKAGLREELIKKKIFTPLLWKNVLQLCSKDTIEYEMTEKLVHIPIDHRYSSNQIINIIKPLIYEDN